MKKILLFLFLSLSVFALPKTKFQSSVGFANISFSKKKTYIINSALLSSGYYVGGSKIAYFICAGVLFPFSINYDSKKLQISSISYPISYFLENGIAFFIQKSKLTHNINLGLNLLSVSLNDKRFLPSMQLGLSFTYNILLKINTYFALSFSPSFAYEFLDIFDTKEYHWGFKTSFSFGFVISFKNIKT